MSCSLWPRRVGDVATTSGRPQPAASELGAVVGSTTTAAVDEKKGQERARCHPNHGLNLHCGHSLGPPFY